MTTGVGFFCKANHIRIPELWPSFSAVFRNFPCFFQPRPILPLCVAGCFNGLWHTAAIETDAAMLQID
jgi:hypothetical protein